MKINDIIQRAHAEIGTKEIPANSNNVKYNTWYYGKNVTGSSYPWCCAFISWLFRDAQELCKKSASCVNLLSYFEKNGQIVTASKAQAGDIIFFKYARNNTRTNHVGIVVGRSGNTFSTIEGNTSASSDDNGGAVMNRKRSTSIVAFARPNYDDAWIELKKGSRGVFVKKLQQILNDKFNAKLTEDGSFGNLTYNAVIMAQAQLTEVGTNKPLKKDGIVGEKTWKAIL